MPDSLSLTWPESDIGLITFDTPSKRANILSSAVLDQFETLLGELEQRANVAGVILRSAKPGAFIAGADLHEIAAMKQGSRERTIELCRRGHRLWSRLSRLSAVSVAAIDGVCLGGGTELSLWCDERLVTNHPKTEIGLPEVKLGLIPGWGGTVRLPRLVGLPQALEMIVGGEPVDASQAVALGLAIDAVADADLLPAAIRFIRREQQSQAFLKRREERQRRVEMDESELALLQLSWRQRLNSLHGDQNPAKKEAFKLLCGAASLDEAAALDREAEAFADLFSTPASDALLHVYFLTDRNKRDPGIDHLAFKPSAVRSLGVIGAGIMGAGIAAATVRGGIPVALTDSNAKAVTAVIPRVLEEAAYDRRSKASDPSRAVQLASLLSGGSEAVLEPCDLVIEAIVENPEIKQQLFARVEPRLSADAILASNTSTIPITRLAEGLLRPEQFCGMHFFNPVKRMKLVEVIRGAQTSDETIARAVAFCKAIGKMPVVVNDGPGFMVNRLLFPYMNEAIELLHDGISIEQIDRSAVAFGMPLGPIALYDMVGLDTAMYAGRTMYQAFPERVAVSPLVPALVKRGRLGHKTGKGFFSYESKSKSPVIDEQISKMLEDYCRRKLDLTDEQVQQRLFLPMLLEATRLLEEHVARDVRDIDLGLIHGLGFPATKGGLLYWADTVGAADLLAMLTPLENLGPRMQPTPMLREMAAQRKKFYVD